MVFAIKAVCVSWRDETADGRDYRLAENGAHQAQPRVTLLVLPPLDLGLSVGRNRRSQVLSHYRGEAAVVSPMREELQ